jgi:tetratricopeptide (TPR) repeat protein
LTHWLESRGRVSRRERRLGEEIREDREQAAAASAGRAYTDSTPMRRSLLRATLALMGLSAIGGAVWLSGALPSAQTPPARAPAPASPLDAAAAAINTGRYDEVDGILGGSTDRRAALLRARAAIARGRYPEAEKLLAAGAASDPGGDAAVELGGLQMYLGRRQDASRTFQRVLSSVSPRVAADFVRLGTAARRLGRFQEANGFFRDGNRLTPDDPAVNVGWGELFLEKYNKPDALKSFQAAAKADAVHVGATYGVARVAQEGNPPAAKEALDRVLETNPNHVGAHLLLAEMALDDRRRDDARASIRTALEVNPNSLEARSLDAAIAFLEGRTADVEAQVKQVLQINPSYGELYRVAGDHVARNYRFEEAVELVRKGLALDEANTRAYADLGSHLLRTGDEPAARQALERAFKDDPFNAVTLNSLRLLDVLAKFETVTEGDIVFRFHPDEVAVMREQAMPLAQEALATLSKLYEFKPTGPILVEMFPEHDDFAVRTIGLPGFVGALGACFGKVVTLDSPRARRRPGEFNWGETLWHEMAHVITLQMSNNRLPRWVSEGISMWEERRARPEWGWESDLSFVQALEADKLLKLDALNAGFSDPKTISLAYYEASQVIEHLVAAYGEPALRAFLRAYGRGLETDEALKAAFNVTLPELQTSFDAMLARKYSALRTALKTPEIKGKPSVDELKAMAASNPGSFGVQMSLGAALQGTSDKAGAIQAFERAAALVPRAMGENSPHVRIASVATEMGNTARAIQALETAVRTDPTDIESARKLTALLANGSDAARAEEAYRRLVAIDPFDSAGQTGLGRLALQRKDTATALRAFRAALASNAPDRAAAHTDLGEAHLLAGQAAEARKQTLAALEIAPSFERAQDLLLKLVDGAR